MKLIMEATQADAPGSKIAILSQKRTCLRTDKLVDVVGTASSNTYIHKMLKVTV